jgi:hypothetical protein
MSIRPAASAALLVLCVLGARPALAAPKPVPAAISSDQATGIVWKLPEIKAWSAYILRTSHGKIHAALMVTPEEPVEIEGKRYWTVGFFENQPEKYLRWETFLVRLDGRQILVEDATSGDNLTLEQWRRQEKPMDRVR